MFLCEIKEKKLLINIFANIHVTCNKCWSLILMVPNINVFKLTVLLDFSIIRFTRTTYADNSIFFFSPQVQGSPTLLKP